PGNYPATYGFENDLSGTNPLDWVVTEPADTDIQVIKTFNIKIDREHELRTLGLDPSKQTVGTVGRFIEEKGHIYLYQAIPMILKKHPRTQFLIVGDGRLKSKMTAYLSEKPYRQIVHMVGLREEVPKLLALMDVFVFPSLQEAFGIAPVEAMAAKCPVACSSIPTLKEIVEDQETGLLFKPSDPISMANAVNRLLSSNELRKKISRKAYKNTMLRFSETKSIRALEQLYLKILNI
ncbi:MAG: glycosyltransferase family 4 protein, partial [Candidatus Thorarchaeota archaeon]